VRVSCCERIKRLRRKRIEHWVDGIGVRGLQPGVRLKTKPCRIFWVDVVIETDGLYLLVVVAGVRDALPVGATIPGGAKRATKDCCGCAVCISVEAEHLLIEQTVLIRIAGPTAGCLPPRKLLQDVCLERRTGNDRRRDDGQCYPHPFTIKEEEQLVVRDRPTDTASKMVHGRSRFVVSRRRVGKVVRCIQ